MQYQEFEKGLKGTFHNAETTVDMTALLEGIYANKPKKDRKVIWLWFGFFAILAIAGTIALNKIISNNHTELTFDSANSLVAVKSSESPNTNEGKATLINSNETPEKIESPIALETSEKTKVNINSKSNLENNTIQLKTKEQISAYPATQNESTLYENLIQSQGITAPSIKKINISDSAINSKVEELNTQKSFDLASGKLNNENRSLIGLNLLDSRENSLMHKRLLPVKDYVDCPTFKNSVRWVVDIIPEAGFILPIKALDNNSVGSNEIFEKRAMEETPLEGLQVGLYARVRPESKPYYIKFGASYTRVSERMKLDVNWTESDTTQGIISITESQDGDTLTVIWGDIVTETEFSRKSTDHYFLKMIDIPVAVGYTQSIGHGWRAGIEGGVQFNISVSSSGKLYESTGQNSYTDLPAAGRFESNVGISFFGGLTFEKAISNNGAIYFSPRFRYFPKKFTPASYSVSQGYQFAGIHAGYIHSF